MPKASWAKIVFLSRNYDDFKVDLTSRFLSELANPLWFEGERFIICSLENYISPVEIIFRSTSALIIKQENCVL